MQQDSFDARLQGQKPESIAKAKTGKGWMICSIVLLVILIGVSVFGGMIIAKGNRDTNRLSEVEAQLKEKDAKIAEIEKAEPAGGQEISNDTKDVATIDFAGLRKITATEYGSGATLSVGKLEYTKDGKYIYAIAGVGSQYGSDAGVWYRSAAAGSSWKLLNRGQATGDCSLLSDEVKSSMKEDKSIEDDMPSKYLACKQADGSTFPE